MQCDICKKSISLADFQPSSISADDSFDFTQDILHICAMCNAKAQEALDRSIERELEVQSLLRQQLEQLNDGRIVDYQAELPESFEIHEQSPSTSLVVESSEAGLLYSIPDEIVPKSPVESSFLLQTDIEILFGRADFRKPENMDELNVLIERLCVLLHYLGVDGVFPALPSPFFFTQDAYHVICFHHLQKIKNKVNTKAKEQLDSAARGLSAMIRAAIDRLSLNLKDIFSADGLLEFGGANVLQGDDWATWECLWPALERLIDEIWKGAQERENQSKWGR